ncbi:ABC-2 type transport system permease protein [Dyadobacter sp. BE34]|uniref:ABC-2 type transport system permease protein n=1 Tax=Dyadobacter fermentans TaxID=94254 RepID=A0ABU1R6F2_9BACT|nr:MULTISPECIES: ABC transporter permease [Dyadobacter]MDR6808986.1 ABC-2 type transport system permease protein [Dyadobacter fermentans]MDR7046729.1 ABC-2 type transport system permease protein [Dyadobacter sp. BE242]MDR7201043.1 ABC-2 type transport system permease protein [Dyadobacter sp. BE34]MDR7219003.1 ABC-2 type transport system permease protein [Dyadobacter sp. BE31]MDR7264787.1 ABC-2 type transport system permease protein [Dyadobacter sp. BE32]
MRTLRFLLRKEFRQIFRDKAIVAMIFFMPMVQLILMPLAADYEVRNINLSVVDHDKSSYSQKLISKIVASGYFRLTGYNASFKEAFGLIESDKADLILEIPHDFERNLIREDHEKLFVAVNAINGTKASLGGSYLGSIIGDFNADIRMQLVTPPRFSQFPVIDVVASNWFNPVLNYKVFIVPGILAILVTMVGGFLSALNIVREKEIGTIEQINVTPIRKHIFILGKLIPFWVLANIVFTIGLLVARFVYGIVPVGSLLTLYAFISVYLLAVLGFGLLVSTFCDTQQQAMFIMFFFMMLFILLGGLFTSIDSMPEWAKLITRVNPVRYMIEVMRMVILKGSSFADVLPHVGVVALMAVILNGWAILNYKKTN